MGSNAKHPLGFTLIELAIVLVVIGLIVGGVLVGQSLISAAAVRAQITQIEKFNTAANTFYGKYGGLPGDLNASAATQYGFVARAGSVGRGDGNGELDGFYNMAYSRNENGENLMFWEDLSSASLIDQTFNAYVDGQPSTACTVLTCSKYLPSAKIGGGNVIYTYSGYAANCCGSTGTGPNFFGLSVTTIGASANVSTQAGASTAPGLTVAQAYAIDSKIDDGYPMSGNILAQYLSNNTPLTGAPGWSASAATDSSTTCYNTATSTATYSIAYNSGSGVNCALSFRIQAGD